MFEQITQDETKVGVPQECIYQSQETHAQRLWDNNPQNKAGCWLFSLCPISRLSGINVTGYILNES